MKARNVPYVKKYDTDGKVINPVIGAYIHEYDNRKKRRIVMQKARFYGESKNVHLTIIKGARFLRLKQIEFDKKGFRKTIEHYIPR
jgi:hypothetical protein